MSSKKEVLDKLHFSIAEVSSQDVDHPVSELNSSSPQTRGWQSAKNCSYPQTIVLQIHSPPNRAASLSQLQILSHQSKIPKKIEIVLASNDDEALVPSFNQCQRIRRLGYVSFDSNEKSGFQARELKSVNIGFEKALFVKLVVHQCHLNGFNLDKQVSIVAINMLGNNEGEQLCQVPSPQVPTTRQEQQTSPSQISSPQHTTTMSKPPLPELDPAIQVRLDKLEHKKKKKADTEDFDGAARLKEVLSRAKKMIYSFQEIEVHMRKAAAEEDYIEASRLKKQRDAARISALNALDDAERSALSENQTVAMNQSQSSLRHRMDSPVRETPKKPNMSSETSNRAHFSPYHSGERCQQIGTPIVDGEDGYDSASMISETEANDEQSETYNDEDHPLDGVPNFQELPLPEDVNDTGGDPKDFIQKVESILGNYRTRCFFSKNWSLREASLTKTSLILPEIRQHIDLNDAAPVLCSMLERAVNDRIIQVFLTSLILLDNCLTEFEMSKMSPKDVVPLFGKVILSLVGRLADIKPKVVEGAETTLTSMALSSCVGPAYIGNYVLKQMKPRDVKSGRAVCARFRFLQKLVIEFGEEAVTAKQVMSFIKGSANGFSHKDAEVREAAKQLTTEIYKVIGNRIFAILDCLSDRQMREYRASFALSEPNEQAISREGDSNVKHGEFFSPSSHLSKNRRDKETRSDQKLPVKEGNEEKTWKEGLVQPNNKSSRTNRNGSFESTSEMNLSSSTEFFDEFSTSDKDNERWSQQPTPNEGDGEVDDDLVRYDRAISDDEDYDDNVLLQESDDEQNDIEEVMNDYSFTYDEY